MLLAASLPAVLCVLLARSQAASQAPVLPTLDAEITRAELEHHVRFLASDELGGRAPLSVGAERSADYLAAALAASGVEPAGIDGSYFRATGLERHSYPSRPRLLFFDEAGATVEAQLGVDFNLHPRGRLRSTEKLPLRFFYDYNHARMPLVGNAAEAIYFSGPPEAKRRILAEKGIPSLADWGLELAVVPGEAGLEPGKPKDTFEARLVDGAEPDRCETIELRGPLRIAFERREYTHVQLLAEEYIEPRADRSVLGRVRGVGTPEHPELAREVVLLFANYDCDGSIHPQRKAAGADALFNGADDNASGCAALLELAQAFARGPAPARTLLFLFTGSDGHEEHGLRTYLAAPAAPLADTVAAFGFERLGRPDPALASGTAWLTGFHRGTLGPAFAAAGLSIAPEPRPDLKFFQRAHSQVLVKAGLVAHTLSSYGLQPESGTPADSADTLDYAHLEAATREARRALALTTDGSLRPAWAVKSPEEREKARATAAEAKERARKRRLPPGDDEATGDEGGDESAGPREE